MSPLQKRAVISLILGVLLTIILIVVFLTKDIYTFDDDLTFRLIVYALWVAVPLVFLITIAPITKKPDKVDERDRLIMERAPRIQFLAVLFSLVAWVIVLTEAFREQGQVPVIYLNLIMISTLIISTLAQSAGILIGYWRMR
jgi:hypothetical protein